MSFNEINKTSQECNIHPPVAKEIPHVTELHGKVLSDPWFWLRERENAEVMSYLAAENEYTELMMAKTVPLQEELYAEMVGRIKEDDTSVPYVEGDYKYYSRIEKGQQYAVYLRAHVNTDVEELLLDCNLLAQEKEYFSLGSFAVSPDGKYLAYSIDENGSELYTLYVKDLDSGHHVGSSVKKTTPGVEWAADSRTLFYVTLDEIIRPYRLYRHLVDSDSQTDHLIYEEEDERFFLSISSSQSREYLFLGVTCSSSTEFYFLHSGTPEGFFTRIFERQNDLRYYPEHHGEHFLILTNEDAKDFRLMALPIETLSKDEWQTIIPHKTGNKIEDVLPFEGHIVTFERDEGLDQVRILDVSTGAHHIVPMPDQVYSICSGDNPVYGTDIIRFYYSSPVRPESVFDYSMTTGKATLLKTKEIPSGHNVNDYVTERVFSRSHDGTAIPVTLLYKKGTPRNGSAPCLLYGYGSYGITIEPRFRSTIYNYVDRGFVYAIGHIRGGGLLGETWYDNGKMLNKKNTFYDFISVAEYLIGHRYTSSGNITIEGGSAGGLLIGAVVNIRPDLFNAAVADVPFVDSLNTMLDASIPLTVTEYDEWGNPHDPEYFEYMHSYAPYEQVKAKEYPHLLIMGGLNDPRVQYWEPAKWTAKLRKLKKGNKTLLLKTNMDAGHGGASGRYEYLKEVAFIQAFVISHCRRRDEESADPYLW
jgi:oligopeptidase B